MKKINGKKLAMQRETLASLSPDVLGDVNGGMILPNTTIPQKVTKYLCPVVSRLVCPPSRACLAGAGGNNGGGNNAGGEGQG